MTILCKICNTSLWRGPSEITSHVRKSHKLSLQEYYDKHIKPNLHDEERLERSMLEESMMMDVSRIAGLATNSISLLCFSHFLYMGVESQHL